MSGQPAHHTGVHFGIFTITFVCIYRCRKQYKGIIQEKVELAKRKCEVKKQQAAEMRLHEETRKTRLKEEEEGLRVLKEERLGKEKEQQLKTVEVEKTRQEGNKQLKQMEMAQAEQSVKLLADETEVQQESGNECETQRNSQQKAESLSRTQQQGKVKFDEENRLHERLKQLQEQAVQQKENELSQKVSEDTTFAPDNSLTDNEVVKKKHKQKLTVTKESEKQLHEQKRLEEKCSKQKQLMQEEYKGSKSENAQVYQNNRKVDSQQKPMKHAKRKEAEKIEECSNKKEEEKVKQKQRDNKTLPQDVSSPKRNNLTEINDPTVEQYDSTVRVNPGATAAHVRHNVKLQLSMDVTKNSIKHEHNQSTFQNEVISNTSSKIISQAQQPSQAKKNTCRESSNVWEKTAEAKRLDWMLHCESWRYVVVL